MSATEIKRLDLTVKEQAELDFLRGLEFPRHYDLFMILPFPLIKKWVYGLDPRVAVVVCGDPEFVKMFEFKRTEGSLDQVLNWIIRRIRGIC